MKRVLFCMFILSAACGGDPKKTTTTGDDLSTGDTSETTTEDGTETSTPGDTDQGDSGDASEPAAPEAGGSMAVLPPSWSKKEVKKYMKQLTKGLGVQCDFCHDMSDFASDANPKKIKARTMLKMTRRLDKENFEGKGRITCNTCHKGKLEP